MDMELRHKIILFAIVSVLLLLAFYFFVQYDYAKIKVNTAVVKEGPGTKYETIEKLSKGKELEIMGNKNGWLRVVAGTYMGWIRENDCSVYKKREFPIKIGKTYCNTATDELGFTFLANQLYDPNAHGLPLYNKPNTNSKIIRTVKQLESFSRSNREENGMMRVRMNSDNAMGWLTVKALSPDSNSKGKHNVKGIGNPLAFIKVAKAFVIAIIVTLILKLLGVPHALAERIDTSVVIIEVMIAGFVALGTSVAIGEVVPFDINVAKMRHAYAVAATYWSNVTPTIIASSVVYLFETPAYNRFNAFMGFIASLVFCLGYYSSLGMLAGWWM